MKCDKCGLPLTYKNAPKNDDSGWEHYHGERCRKIDIKNHKLVQIKHEEIWAQHELNIIKERYKKVLEEE